MKRQQERLIGGFPVQTPDLSLVQTSWEAERVRGEVWTKGKKDRSPCIKKGDFLEHASKARYQRVGFPWLARARASLCRMQELERRKAEESENVGVREEEESKHME